MFDSESSQLSETLADGSVFIIGGDTVGGYVNDGQSRGSH